MTSRELIITATRLDFLKDPYGTPLEHYTAKQTTKKQASLTNRSRHMHQCLVTTIDNRDSLDIL